MEQIEANKMIVSKRVYITLPDSVYDALERWADDQGRPTANLAAYVVEKAIEEAQKEGKIPPDKNGSSLTKGKG